MNKIMYLFFLLIVFIAALLFVGIAYQYIATKYNDLRYPPPGQFVDVHGKKIHYLCMGNNKPIVILDAGLGADHQWWHLVQPQVAEFAQVISFDRPGYGWSDAVEDSHTSAQIVSKLHEFLQTVGLKPPYILVGHSFGGANMRLFANTYPDQVAAVVLVDACHEDQNFEKDLSSKGFGAQCKDYFFNSTFSHYAGISRWVTAENLSPFFSSLMPQYLRETIIAKASSVKSLRTRDNEMVNLKESLSQLKKSKNALSDKPLIVITAEETNNDPQWEKHQKQLVSLSNKGKQIIAKNSSHMVNVDKPDVIVNAIKETIELC